MANSSFSVILTPMAESDLVEIYSFILQMDGREQAQKIKERLKDAIRSLQSLPGRGKCPLEMRQIGVDDFKELQSAPWRIFYYIDGQRVYVVAVLDGRRNITEMLAQRLTR